MFAVFGNPIKHSKSAEIYSLFAKEIGIDPKYDLKLVFEENFDAMLHSFFKSGGLGANITAPFKERAVLLCDRLTNRAMIANAVNTVKKQHDNTLLGDNTDGIGFIMDLHRLHWFDHNFSIIDATTYIEKFSIKPIISNILIIGSGGASKGIIPILLEKYKGCYVNVVNRTFINAQKLVNYFYRIGRQNISCININTLFLEYTKQYDLIINATSSSMDGNVPLIPTFLIRPYTKCYDLFYQKQDTAFLQWCKKHGSLFCADGLGMLIGQAACSFYLWHGVYPSVNLVFDYFRNKC